MRKIVIYLLLVTVLILGVFSFGYQGGNFSLGNIENLLAGVFFIDSITKEELVDKYTLAKQGGEKVRILIVPGHDDQYGGAYFRGTREADLNREAGERLAGLFINDGEFEIILARNQQGYNVQFK